MGQQRGESAVFLLVLTALFVALIIVGAFIKVPVPVVPFTLQFFFTTCAGLFLGPRRGFCAVAAYIVLGLAGLPVFASGGGPAYVLQPSFGYLLGFALGAAVSGALAGPAQSGLPRLLGACFAGLAVVYGLGLVWYGVVSAWVLGTPIGLWPLFLYGFLLAVPGDLALCLLAALLARRVRPLMSGGPR